MTDRPFAPNPHTLRFPRCSDVTTPVCSLDMTTSLTPTCRKRCDGSGFSDAWFCVKRLILSG